MKAWVKRGEHLELSDAPLPVAATDEMLVKVRAISLNRGELRTAIRATEGAIPGWDIAGTVVTPAADGRGPAEGSHIAALLNSGGWAEYARVPVTNAAIIPTDVDLGAAATLPIAGLTVLRALAVAGSTLGKRLLITGGSGGVGQLAIRLGAMSGATVTTVSSKGDLQTTLLELGATNVVRTIEQAVGSYDLILESVGGSSLATAIGLVAPEGVVVTIGNSTEEETTFNARTLYARGAATIYGLLIFEEVRNRRVGERELSYLLELVRRGELRPLIEIRRDWLELKDVLKEFENRTFSGKAVLTIA